jgi:peroxiredoxin
LKAFYQNDCPPLAGSFYFTCFFEKEPLMLKNLAILSIVLLTLTAGCVDKDAQQGDLTAPDFTLQDMNGKTVRLSDQKGKVVLIEFWATWCPPCRTAVPVLELLYKAYRDKGLVVLAVSMDEGGWDQVASFIAEHHLTFTVLKGTDRVAEKYRVRAIPMMLILNREGKIAKRYLGMGTDEEVERDIKALL